MTKKLLALFIVMALVVTSVFTLVACDGATIALSKTSLSLEVGGSETITLNSDGVALSDATWASSDSAVATVDGGLITAVSAGSADITATYNSVDYKCAVTVSAAAATTFTVTFYDGDTVLSTQEVEDGAKATKPATDPTSTGEVFVNWFATPTFSRDFDFDTAIEADTSVFAGFSTYQEDTREFSIVGSGTSSLLLASKWGTVFTDDMVMTKDADSNTYTITLDLQAGDQFQFAITGGWTNQRGFGYLETTQLPDGTVAFSGAGGLGDASSKSMNITVVESGNYTFTLTTYPADDYYDTEDSGYTEAGKEDYNIGTFDRISFVRNGDVLEEVTSTTAYYIKGAGITEWANMYNKATILSETNDADVVEGTFYLAAGEEFMFITQITVGTVTSEGTVYLRYSNLDETSAALFTATASYNIIATAAGDYTFSYNTDTGVLSATLADGDGSPEVADYYLSGTFDSTQESWNDYLFKSDYKLVYNEDSGLYEISNVAMSAGEFVIQPFAVGTTDAGDWGDEVYFGVRNYTYVNGGDGIVEASEWNNIVILADGTYSITYNAYSHIITIVDVTADMVVGLKGNMNSWNPLADGYVFTAVGDGTFELTVELEVGSEFGLAVDPSESSYGTWVGRENLGSSGDANDLFGDSGNPTATVAGTYKIVYDSEAGTMDIYKVVAAD